VPIICFSTAVGIELCNPWLHLNFFLCHQRKLEEALVDLVQVLSADFSVSDSPLNLYTITWKTMLVVQAMIEVQVFPLWSRAYIWRKGDSTTGKS
jgi:hypothetical protein